MLYPVKKTVFDGMIFPEIFSISSVKKLKNFIFGQDIPKEMPIPNHEVVQKECLYFFLQEHKKIIEDLAIIKYGFVKLADKIYGIFEQLRSQCVCRDSSFYTESRLASNLPMVCTVLYN